MSENIELLLATAAANFTPIVGQPTDDDIFNIKKVLMPILHNIEYDMAPVAGRALHNLVGLIQPIATYVATWTVAFPIPVRLPTYDPTIPDAATSVVRNRMEAAHTAALRDYATFLAAEKGTSLFIRAVVEEVWYKDLRDPITYYNNVTAYNLLDHLVTNSGGLHSNELATLPSEMLQYYATAEGIPEFILALEEAREKLARGGIPMSDATLLATASLQVYASLHFPEATREWEQLPPASRTWAAWQTKYRQAHIERKRLLLVNANSFGSASNAMTIHNDSAAANAAINSALDNIANAATNDSTVMASILAKLTAMDARITAIQKPKVPRGQGLVEATNNLTPTEPPPYVPRVYTPAEALRIFDPTGYCHTHGYRVVASHTSESCKKKGRNHVDDATRADTKKGSKKNKGWETSTATM